MSKNKKKPLIKASDHYNGEMYDDPMFDYDAANTISHMECTGLIPRGPVSEDEREAYSDIMNYSPDDINIYNIPHEHNL